MTNGRTIQVTNCGRALSSIGLQVNISSMYKLCILRYTISDNQDVGGVAGNTSSRARR
jgi:hypothetical protein